MIELYMPQSSERETECREVESSPGKTLENWIEVSLKYVSENVRVERSRVVICSGVKVDPKEPKKGSYSRVVIGVNDEILEYLKLSSTGSGRIFSLYWYS
jgi:hypothetical protein